MSVSAFLASGDVRDFLVQRGDESTTKRVTSGRPVVVVFGTNKIGIVDPSVENDYNGVKKLNVLLSMLKSSLVDSWPLSENELLSRSDRNRRNARPAPELPEGVNNQRYVLWEVWMDRRDGAKAGDGYSDLEKNTILKGFTEEDRNVCSVVRVIRKIKDYRTWKKVPVYFFKDFNLDLKEGIRIMKNGNDFELPSYELEKDFLSGAEFNVGSFIDITTVGTSCGGLFQFPHWVDEKKLDSFIKKYNSVAEAEIRFSPRPTKAARLLRYKEMNKTWLPFWMACVNGNVRPDLHDWTNTFSVSLLGKQTFGSMSMFTWYGEKYTPEEVEGGGEDGMELAVTSGLDGYLVPVDLVLSWSGMLKFLRLYGGPLSKPDMAKYKIKTSEAKNVFKGNIPENVRNIYALLLKANGGQGIEHVNLSSFLGSAAHTSAALKALAVAKEFNAGEENTIPTTIVNVPILERFSRETPKIAQLVGNVLAETKVSATDERRPDEVSTGVEFGVYLVNRTFNGKYFYSRVDALGKDYIRNEGNSLWEYKSKWGDDRSIITDALLDDLLQSAFYCYCMEKMTGIVEKFIYVRYVKIECTADEPDVSVYTHKYRWRLEKVRGLGNPLWDFDKMLGNVPL